MIDVQDLVKRYGPTLAVDRIGFRIPQGQVVGFLGPNGAGKSTTIRILTGYLPPSSGQARIDGQDVMSAPKQARARIGYLPESNPLYPEMRVEEYLDYRGRLYEMPATQRRRRIAETIDRCGLSPVRRRTIGALSKGNRQRVGLAQALLHEPPVLILDEPTSGLDPNQVQQFRALIQELRGRHTILLSTHILPEVEKVADQVIVIAAGRIVAQGSPEELRQTVAQRSHVLLEIQAPADMAIAALRPLVAGDSDIQSTVLPDGWNRITLCPPSSRQDLRPMIADLVARSQWPLRELRYQAVSLEQFFVQITAEQAHQPSAS